MDGKNIDIKEFQRGIQIIIEAFNEQKKQYIKIINSMNERINSLEHIVNKLKEENSFYQNKLQTLQKNIKCISKSICQLKDDEILINDKDKENSKIIEDKDKNNLNENESFLKSILDKKNITDYFEINNSNKFEIQDIKNKNQKNKFNEKLNYYTNENDISNNKRDIIYMKAINKLLSNRISKNKKDISNINNKALNQFNIDTLKNIKIICNRNLLRTFITQCLNNSLSTPPSGHRDSNDVKEVNIRITKSYIFIVDSVKNKIMSQKEISENVKNFSKKKTHIMDMRCDEYSSTTLTSLQGCVNYIKKYNKQFCCNFGINKSGSFRLIIKF